jgi:BirA family biotin operon repressor/biotin-[acetyl-CoA-carboxylase] ligase
MLFDADLVRARVPERDIVWLESTASTMTVAARLAAAGCAPGTVVVAEEQTAGQGRHGRRWHSEKGAGLYVSIVLGKGLPPDSLQSLTLALGLAAREAILLTTGVSCELKWPNDLLVGGRKCAGILVQRTAAAAIAGIGVNVNQTAFPPELEGSATSLRMVAGEVHSREGLLVRLLESVDKRISSGRSRAARKGDRDAVGVGCGQQ